MSDENQEQDDGSNILGALGFTAVMSLTMLGSYATYYLAEVDSTPFRQTEAEKRVERRKKSLMSQLQEEPYDELKKRDIEITEQGKGAELAPTSKSLRYSIRQLLETGFFTFEAEKEIRDNIYELSVPRIIGSEVEINGEYSSGKITLNSEEFTHESHYTEAEKGQGSWRMPRIVEHNGGYFKEVHPETRCNFNHTLVHEIFHDIWDNKLEESQREAFESAMMNAYSSLEEKEKKLQKAGSQIADELETPRAQFLRKISKKTDVEIDYKRLFTDEEYGSKIGRQLMEIWSEKEKFSDLPILELTSYIDPQTTIEIKGKITDPTKNRVKDNFKDQVLRQAVKEVEEVESLSSYRTQKDIFKDKLPLYQKEIYGNSIENPKEYFAGVEGYAFMGEYLFRRAMDKGGPKEVYDFLKSSNLDKFYSDFIDLDKD